MAIKKAITANDYQNCGGTVLLGGNATTSGATPAVSNVLGKGSLNYHSGRYGASVPVYSATSGNKKAVSAGNWAKMVANQYVIKGYCSYLGGVANTKLNSSVGAGNIHKSIHAKTTRVTVHITSWNYATGVATKGANTTDDFGADNAATPTASVPGELTYLVTGLTPTQTDYEARKLW